MLGPNDPAQGIEPRNDLQNEGGVPFVQQLCNLSAAPARSKPQRYTNRLGDPSQQHEGGMREFAALYLRDDRLADSCRHGHVDLAEAAPDAHSPDDTSDSRIVHPESMIGATKPRLNPTVPYPNRIGHHPRPQGHPTLIWQPAGIHGVEQ